MANRFPMPATGLAMIFLSIALAGAASVHAAEVVTTTGATIPAGTTAPTSPAGDVENSLGVLDFPPAVRPATAGEEARLAEAITEFNAAATQYDRAGMARLSGELLDTLDATYGDSHPLRAFVAGRIAMAMTDVGDFDNAGALFAVALGTLESTVGPVTRDTRAIARGMADLLLQMDVTLTDPAWPGGLVSMARFGMLDGGFDAAARLDADDTADLAFTAAILEAEGLLEPAEAARRRVLAERIRLFDDGAPEIATAQDRLARLLLRVGELDEAERLAAAALSSREHRSGADSLPVADSLQTLALVRAAGRDPVESEAMLRRSVSILEATLWEGHPKVVDARLELGRYLARRGRNDEAMALIAPALANARSTGRAGPRTLLLLVDVLGIARVEGHCAEVEPLLADMTRGLRPGTSNLVQARVREAYASSLACIGDFAGAGREADRALSDLFGQLGGDHPEVEAMASRLGVLLSGDPATMDAAARYMLTATGIARYRRRLAGIVVDGPGHDASSSVFADQLRVDWRLAARGDAFADVYRNEAFVAAQEIEPSAAARARALGAARFAAAQGPVADAVRRQQDLLVQIARLDRTWTAATATGDVAGAARARAELDRLRPELEASDRWLASHFPEYARLAMPAPLSIREVQQRLAADAGLILVVPAGGDVHVFAVSRAGFEWTRVEGAAQEISDTIGHLRCQLDEATCAQASQAGTRGVASVFGQAASAGGRAFDRSAAHALYARLISPVEDALAGAQTVYLATTGPLGELPPGLLVTRTPLAGEDDADPTTLRDTAWLADRYAFVSLPAVSSLDAVQAIPASSETAMAGGFIGFGDPVLAGYGEANRGAVGGGHPAGSGADGDGLAAPDALRALVALPGTRVELSAMSSLFDPASSRLRMAGEATESAVKHEDALGSARVVAFATHGLLPNEVRGMEEPGLVFTPPAVATVEDDGVLTASEAAQLSLHAEWVILSACNTAAGDGAPDSESLSGLAKAFLYAGARALLASHWRVSDDATAALTVETLAAQSRTPGITRAQALQQAMRAVRTGVRDDGSAVPGWTPDWAHPADWAPFVVVSGRDG